jgi:cobalt transporter subunit CbtB
MAATLPAPAATLDEALIRKTSLAVPASLAVLLGSLIIGIAGFSHLDVVHNASHDTRHSAGFPCH